MKPSASGRILMWRGGSLWIGQAGEPAEMHAHHAVQVTLPARAPGARLRLPDGDWKTYSAAIVAAEQSHAFDARGQTMVQLFVEPESREGRMLQARCQEAGILELPEGELSNEVQALARAYEARATDEALMKLAREAIGKLAGSDGKSALPPDARITKATDLIRARLSGPMTLESIAKAVHLSPDRFRHLFVQETGVAFRPYVLWLRLECALQAYVGGSSLTEAAHRGGFADSAHFSRTFRRMFGIAPASVRPE
ncbi:MAG TPA: AraC family transcriptional regulator [Steroidobacteraceae bacterium]|nr:AraC family transcriptional regulator [Steroidobacteraceae bacterium]